MPAKTIGKLNYFRKKVYPSGVLLTTDLGTWIFLTNEDYHSFKSGFVEEDLFKKLESNGIIITEDNEKRIPLMYAEFQSQLFHGTSLHIVVPTIRCNQSCVYCYALRKAPDTPNADMDLETATATVDMIFNTPHPDLVIEFTGGEPLMNFPIIKHIVRYAKEKNKVAKKKLEFAVVTNGTLLNDEIVAFLKKEGVGLCLSFDGPEELHNSQRPFFGGGGTYQVVLEKIRALRSDPSYKHRVNLLPVITKQTVQHWKELIDINVELGFNSIRLKYMACFGFAKETWDRIGYTPEEYVKLWKDSIEYMLELNRKGIKVRDGMATLMLVKMLTGKNANFAELNAPCGAVIGQILYNYDGSVYPCDESRIYPEFKLGNVKTDSWQKIVSGPTVCSMLNASSNLSLPCDRCPYYAYCGLCPVHAYSMQGSLVTKLPKDIKCIMHKQMFDYLFDKILFKPEDAKLLREWLDYPCQA